MKRHTGGAARITALLLIVASQAVGGVSLAQSELELAESAYEAGQLDDASSQLQAALRSGHLGPEQVARVYRLVGVLAVADGQSQAALAAFETSLALNPEQTTPPELGPVEAASFDGAREARVAALFEFTAEHDVIVRNAPLTIQVHTTNPPANLVTYRINATAPGAAPWTADEAATSGQVVLEAMAWRGSETLALTISARDRFGNTVAVYALEVQVPQPVSIPIDPAIVVPDEAAAAAPPPPSRRGRRIILAIAGVVLVGAAAGIGVWLARRPVSGQFVLSN